MRSSPVVLPAASALAALALLETSAFGEEVADSPEASGAFIGWFEVLVGCAIVVLLIGWLRGRKPRKAPGPDSATTDVAFLLPLFVGSGAAALIYEIRWVPTASARTWVLRGLHGRPPGDLHGWDVSREPPRVPLRAARLASRTHLRDP